MELYLQRACKWDFWKDEQGQDLIEYAPMAGFVALIAVAVSTPLSTSIKAAFSKIGSAIDTTPTL